MSWHDMSNPQPLDLGLSISIGLFLLSFSWLFAERTSQYPFLRRVTAVLSDPEFPDPSSPHARVMIWGFSYILFWISAASFSFSCIR